MQRQVKLSMFTDADLAKIHDWSLQLLAENGIRIENEKALKYFKDAGFKVDGAQIYMTEAQVQRALDTIPSHFVFHGRDPKYDVDLGSGVYAACTPIGPVDIHTLDEGKRKGTLKDVEDLVKIYHASDVIKINTNNGVEANDTPAETRHFQVSKAAIKNTTKPWYTRLFDYHQMHEIMDMMEIATGEKLEKGGKVWMAPGSCPSLSPMAYSREVADCIVALAERGQAVTLGTATTTGVTGPIHILGTVVMQNAEQLAGMVLTQLINPGNPTGYGVAACPANMRGARYCCGSPGRVMLQMGSIEMGKRFYNMPTRTEPYTTESSNNDIQCGIEAYEGTFGSILSGADYQLGEIGTLDSLMTTSYEKTILDEEITARLLYIKEGIEVSEETSGVENVLEMFEDGNFLMDEDTIDYMHDAWYPKYTDWNREKEVDADRDYVLKRANAEWKRRLAEAPESMLDPELEKELDAYIAAHTR